MENSFKTRVLSMLFVIVVLALIVGGYIYTSQLINSKGLKLTSKKEEEIDYRKDPNKDYVYFENEVIVLEDPEIVHRDAIINLEGAEIINSALATEMEQIKNSVVKLTDENKDNTKELLYEVIDIYSATEREYLTYKTKKYFSLVINDLSFSCYDGFVIKNVKGYIIDLKNSKVISNEEILKEYNLTNEDVKVKVREYLEKNQTQNEGQDVINIDASIENLFNNYAFYVDTNNLYISFIVKSNFVDYNENIKIN